MAIFYETTAYFWMVLLILPKNEKRHKKPVLLIDTNFKIWYNIFVALGEIKWVEFILSNNLYM